jgi:hypothetical protein
MRFYQDNPPLTTAAELFQVDSGSATGASSAGILGTGIIIKQILLINRTTSGAVVTLHLVPSPGTTIANDNIIVPGVTVPANSLITLDVSLVMEAGAAIWGFQGTDNAINVSIHGVVF